MNYQEALQIGRSLAAKFIQPGAGAVAVAVRSRQGARGGVVRPRGPNRKLSAALRKKFWRQRKRRADRERLRRKALERLRARGGYRLAPNGKRYMRRRRDMLAIRRPPGVTHE